MPFGQIPALQDGNLMLFESRAISKYVLRKYSKPGTDLLRESNIEESALVDMWLETEAHQFSPSISPITYQCLIVPMLGGVCDQKLVDESLEKAKKVLEVYEALLGGRFLQLGGFESFSDVLLLLCDSLCFGFELVSACWCMVGGFEVEALGQEGDFHDAWSVIMRCD
ncbi:hypothetical protein LUZ60_010983 [Juncus effusus]|nr:hypothetical protein LUZ60_010983 [Juncus effusus]